VPCSKLSISGYLNVSLKIFFFLLLM
jgi:hypothetical protein